MGESTGGDDATMTAPAVRRNKVASVRESSDRADTTSGAGTVDEEVEVPNTGNALNVLYITRILYYCFVIIITTTTASRSKTNKRRIGREECECD